MWRNSGTRQFQRSFAELKQIYSDKTSTSLKSVALVIYPAHVVCLNFTERRWRCLTVYGYTLLDHLPAGVDELGGKGKRLELDENVFSYAFTVSDVMLEMTLTLQAFWRCEQ